jgi:hypothetical protein
MAHAAGRIGTDGIFLRKHGVEPFGRAIVLSQDRTPFYLRTPVGLR